MKYFGLASTFLQRLKAFLTPLEPEFEDRELNKQFGTAFDMDLVQQGTNEFNKVLNHFKNSYCTIGAAKAGS